MSTHSLQSLLNSMRGRSICSGWGAIAVFGRTELNRLLAEQYLDGLSSSGFLRPLDSGEITVTPDGAETVELKSVVFGKPVLSFESASLTASAVTLTMNIVAGSYTARNYPTLASPMLSSSFNITEDMGFHIKLKISLIQVYGNVDQRGRIMLDVLADPQPDCNLGESESIKARIATIIQSHLAAQPDDWRMLELGMLDLGGNNPLSPTGFVIRTQKAPDFETNPGDGLVAVFIKLKAKDGAFATPVEGSGFPYLIPDDLAAGKPQYSAGLVLNSELIPLLTDTQLDVLKNLLFPGQNSFIERDNGQDRYQPHDLLVLGNITPVPESISISPSFISLKAGSSQEFTARRSDGTVVTNVQWSVSCPDNPLAAGTISSTGVYQVPARSRAHLEQQATVVTARYTRAGQVYSHSASVLAVFESMAIAPRVCTRGVGAGARPVELVASTLSGGELTWPTLEPHEGTLTRIDNNRALYTPPATLIEPVDVQKITVTDALTKETVVAVVVLLRVPHALEVFPFFTPSIVASTPIQLRVTDFEPDELEWEVLGEGTEQEKGTVEDGLFVPPSNPTSPVSVVSCWYRGSSGLSIIQLTEEEEVAPRWRALETFAITAPGQLTQCFANGMQQIALIVEIETQAVSVGGVDIDIPLSDVELSSLTLVDKYTGAEVPFVHFAQEGVEHGTVDWAASKKRNRFRLYSPTPTVAAQPATPSAPAPMNNRVRYRELFLHLAVEGSRTFYAQFQAADGGFWRSNELNKENKEIEVTGVAHTPNQNNYLFKYSRVEQDPNGSDGPASPTYPDGDKFSYYLYSTDFWNLGYAREGRPVGFATMRPDANVSTIQWESDQVDETFASYTGCAFSPATRPNVESEVPTELTYDAYLWGMTRAIKPGELDTSFRRGSPPSPGELLISLHRVDDLPYWYDKMGGTDPLMMYRARLDPGMKFTLLDEEGNRHRVEIGFEGSSLTDSRNFLKVRAI